MPFFTITSGVDGEEDFCLGKPITCSGVDSCSASGKMGLIRVATTFRAEAIFADANTKPVFLDNLPWFCYLGQNRL